MTKRRRDARTARGRCRRFELPVVFLQRCTSVRRSVGNVKSGRSHPSLYKPYIYYSSFLRLLTQGAIRNSAIHFDRRSTCSGRQAPICSRGFNYRCMLANGMRSKGYECRQGFYMGRAGVWSRGSPRNGIRYGDTTRRERIEGIALPVCRRGMHGRKGLAETQARASTLMPSLRRVSASSRRLSVCRRSIIATSSRSISSRVSVRVTVRERSASGAAAAGGAGLCCGAKVERARIL